MLKDEITHFLLSLFAGTLVSLFFGHYDLVPIALLSGFFIDADHLIDYCLFRKFKNFSLKEFFSGRYFDYSGKVYVFFHAFEYVLILLILGVIFKDFQWLYFSLGLSLLFHLLFDTFYNRPKWPTYFVFYRIYHRFNHNYFCFKKKS